MSKKTELQSSTSNATINAATSPATVVAAEDLKDIPSVDPAKHAGAGADWFKATEQSALNSRDQDARSDKAAHQALAMIVLAAEIHSPEFYKDQLKKEGLGLPKNEDALTLAMALHMRLDVGHADPKTKSNHSKALNRLVSAGKQLRVKARGQSKKFDVPFNAEGVAKLMALIREGGGINALMTAYQAASNGKEKADIIALDADIMAELRMQRLAERMTKGQQLLVGLVSRDQNNSIAVAEEIKLTPALKNAIASQFDLATPEVAFLKELLRIGHCVPEFPTNVLVNRYDDPHDTSAPRRRTRRHFVFNPDGTISISQILSDAGVIVTVKPELILLGMQVEGHVEFRTQQVHAIEVNLSGDRASVFDLEVQQVTDSASGIARVRLSSQATVTKDGEEKRSVSVLVQQVQSKTGVLPLTLADYRPKLQVTDVALLPAWRFIADKCGDAIKKNQPVTISMAKGKLTFEVGAEKVPVDVASGTQDFSMQVRPDDFAAVAKGLSDVALVGQFSLGLDPDMLRLSFKTKAAAYSVHVPKRGIDGTRSNRFITKLEPQVWPGRSVDADDTSDAV